MTYSDGKRLFFNRDFKANCLQGGNVYSQCHLRDFRKKLRFWIAVLFRFCMRDCVLTFCFVTTFESKKIDFSYQDQWLIRLSCGEKIVKIYQMVVLEIDVKLRVAFLFAFSILEMSRVMTKLTKWPVHQANSQSSLAIRPIWSESSLCAQMVAQDPRFLYADSEDWSDCADAQVDLSLRWAHRSCCLFYRAAAQILFGLAPHNLTKIDKNQTNRLRIVSRTNHRGFKYFTIQKYSRFEYTKVFGLHSHDSGSFSVVESQKNANPVRITLMRLRWVFLPKTATHH